MHLQHHDLTKHTYHTSLQYILAAWAQGCPATAVGGHASGLPSSSMKAVGLPILAISCILPLYSWTCKQQVSEFI